MYPSELFKDHFNELTKAAKNAITNGDQSFDEWAGQFTSAEEFNKFVAEELMED